MQVVGKGSQRVAGSSRPRVAWRLLRSALAVSVLCIGCGEPPPAAEPPSLEVQYLTGCETQLSGPACIPADDPTLCLWASADTEARLEVEVGGETLAAEPAAVDGGSHFRVEVRETPARIVVRSMRGELQATWERELEACPAWYTESWRLGGDQRPKEALPLLHEPLQSESLAIRARALGVKARLHRAEGRYGEAEKEIRKAIEAHRQAGDGAAEAQDVNILAYLLIVRRDLAGARQALEALSGGYGDSALAVQLVEQMRAVLAAEVGDLRWAMRSLQAAIEVTGRFGMARQQFLNEQLLAQYLQRVGRTAEAVAVITRLLQAPPEAVRRCERGEAANNVGWILLLAREAGDEVFDPARLLEEARTTFDEGCEGYALQRINVRLNLAMARLQEGHPNEASRLLGEAHTLAEKIEGADQDVAAELWRIDLEARVALSQGAPERALQLYRELYRLAPSALSPEALWRATVGRASALEELERTEEALAAYGEAEDLLDDESLQVAMQFGRHGFLGQREEGTRRYLDLLLRSGRTEEALEVARHSRSRLLRTLQRGERLAALPPDKAAQWDRAMVRYRAGLEQQSAAGDDPQSGGSEAEAELDELFAALGEVRSRERRTFAEPRDGEVVLAFHTLPDGWVGFASDAQGVVAQRLGDLQGQLSDPAELSSEILTPFGERLAAAESIRFLPYGQLREVDFHSLPYQGGALLEAKVVSYGLDVEPVESSGTRERAALLVGDPRGDLRQARREVRDAAGLLSGEWTVTRLEGEQAKARSVMRLLPASALFHYAGHADFGDRGWSSGLRLAEGSRLTVFDVLTLRRAPDLVLLSGCETGRGSRAASAESIGLAQAFVTAGSDAVVAALRPVRDRDAALVVRSFYRRWLTGDSSGVALQQAQLELRRETDSADWASFRLIEP